MLNRKMILRVILLLTTVFKLTSLNAQEVIPASGGNATGTGTVTYTVGQLVYTVYDGANGSLTQGVQQPYEISIETGVDELEGVNLTVSAYPNPATDYLILKVDASVLQSSWKLTYFMFDVLGKLLENKKLTGDEMRIAISQYKPSVYFLKVFDGDKMVKTFKIIKN